MYKLNIINCLPSNLQTKDIEIHLSIGESIACAILGPHSKMSRNFWKFTEEEDKKKELTEFSVDECVKLADYFLNNILEKISSEDHPNSKQVIKNDFCIISVYLINVGMGSVCNLNNVFSTCVHYDVNFSSLTYTFGILEKY